MKPASQAQPSRKPLLVAAATLLAIAVLTPVYRLQDLSWPAAACASIIFVLPCVLLGWVTWRLLVRRRRPLPLWRSLAVHAATAVGFSAAWTAVFSALVYLLRPEAMLSFLRQGALWQFVWGLVICGVLGQTARISVQLRERELAAANAELQALRAQLNPHFLFNTLHSLAQLAREDTAATQAALERFGELMRYVLDAGRNAFDVSLEEEIAFVRSYLAVEKLRLGERLNVIEDIDPDSLELGVPPLLLQPLVENAVRHGLAPRREGGTISLKAHCLDERLVIEVSDNGAGADPEAWRRADGLGLKAVTRQLAARFSGKADFEVATQRHAGFAVRLTIPARLPAGPAT